MSYKVAREYAAAHRIKYEPPDENNSGSGSAQKPIDMGIGASSYLAMLDTLEQFYFMLTIAVIVLLVLYNFIYDGKNLSASKRFLVSISPGNLLGAFYDDKLDVKYYYYSFILQGIIVFLLLTDSRKIFQKVHKIKSNLIKQFNSVRHYSLLVEGLPRELKDAKKVYDFFSTLPRVSENGSVTESPNISTPVDSVILLYDAEKDTEDQQELDGYVQEYHAHSGNVAEDTRFNTLYLSPKERIIDTANVTTTHTGPLNAILRLASFLRDDKFYVNHITSLMENRKKYSTFPSGSGVACVIFTSSKSLQQWTDALEDLEKGQGFFKHLYTDFSKQFLQTENAQEIDLVNLRLVPNVEPSDIRYQNSGTYQRTRTIRFLSILVLAAIFVIVFLVIREVSLPDTLSKRNVISWVWALAIKFLDSIFSAIIAFLIPHTKELTDSKTVVRCTAAIFFLKVCFTSFLPWLASLISPSAPPESNYGPKKAFAYGWYYQDAFDNAKILLLSMASDIVMEFIQPVPRLKRLIALLLATSWIDQSMLNYQFIPPEWDLASKMASLMNVIIGGTIISTYYPVMIAVMFVYFFAMRRIMAFMLRNFYRTPKHITFEPIESTLAIVGIVTPTYTFLAGVTHWATVTTDSALSSAESNLKVPGIIMFVISLIFLVALFFFPESKIGQYLAPNKSLLKEKEENSEPYTKYAGKVTNFVYSHPLYTDVGLQRLGDPQPPSSDPQTMTANPLTQTPNVVVEQSSSSSSSPPESSTSVNTTPRTDIAYFSYYSSKRPPQPRPIQRKPESIPSDSFDFEYFNHLLSYPICCDCEKSKQKSSS